MGDVGLSCGEKIRHYRERRGLSQKVFGEMVGWSTSMVSQVERGVKGVDRFSTLVRIAGALRIHVWELVDDPRAAPNGIRSHDSVAGIRAALRETHDTGEPVAATELRRRVSDAWTAWHAAPHRFTVVGPMLARLIADCERTIRTTTGEPRRDAYRHAVPVYRLSRSFLKRVGERELMAMVAERGRTAAALADDPGSIALAENSYALALGSLEDFEGAVEVAVRAAERLRPHLAEDEGLPSIYGDLHLVASSSAANAGLARQASHSLATAESVAASLGGDHDQHFTAFGPTNVAIHRVVVELEHGRPGDALRLARHLDPSGCPSAERRATHMIEVAHCYSLTGNDEGALMALQVAERESSEDVAYDPLGRQITRELIRRGRLRAFRIELERIARHNGVLD